MKIIIAVNPLLECGLTSSFLQKLNKQGGPDAIRQAVTAQKRSASKIFHPDIAGKETAFYKKFLDNASLIEKMSDEELVEHLKRLRGSTNMPDATPPIVSSPKILQTLLPICSKGHLPIAQEINFYPLMPPGTKYVMSSAKDADKKKPPLSVIRPIKRGIEHRRLDVDEWLQEEGIFFIGSFDRKIDNLLRTILPLVYRDGMSLLLPGQTSGGRTTLLTMTIPNQSIIEVEKLYAPELIPPKVLALVDARGNLLHAGYIAE